MACGCESSCVCNVVGIGYIEVTRAGDTFTVGVDMPIKFVEDTDCIALSVDDETRTLRAVPILAPAAAQDASVQLRCSDDGLTGDVVVDPASTAPVSLTPDGLRIDLPPPAPAADAASPGTLKLTSSVRDEAGWLDADGGDVSRITFPALHDAVSLITMVGSRTLGSAQITNARTKYLKAGMPAEVSGFPPGMTVASIDGPFTLTVSDVAFSSGADSEVRVYPYGNGDGGGTFDLPLIAPDEFVKQMLPGEGMGSGGGASLSSIEIANMPPHEHAGTTATDAGHGHGASASSASTSEGTTTIAMDPVGAHNHEPGTARDSQFVIVEDTISAGDYVTVASLAGTAATFGVSIPTYGGVGNRQQGDRSFTSNDGGHTPTGTASTSVSTSTSTSVSVDPGYANISVDVALEGSGVDMENRPLFRAFRWVVKT